jgi:hypothetical protein
MDISGEHQTELEHDIAKTRISKDGTELETTKDGRERLTREGRCTYADSGRQSSKAMLSEPTLTGSQATVEAVTVLPLLKTGGSRTTMLLERDID